MYGFELAAGGGDVGAAAFAKCGGDVFIPKDFLESFDGGWGGHCEGLAGDGVIDDEV